MKRLIVATIVCGMLFSAGTAMGWGDDMTLHQTYPGTSARDFSKPGLRFDNDSFGGGTTLRQTLPGTSVPDYSKPGLRIERDSFGNTEMYQTLPGTSVRDFSKPGYIMD